MNPLRLFCLVVTGLCGFALTGSSASIIYPNQAYTFTGGDWSPLPGAFNVKAVAAEGDRILAVKRDGRVLAYGMPQNIVDSLTNIVAVELNYTMAMALTAEGRVIELDNSPYTQPAGLTNVIAIDVSGQFNDDDLDYKLAVTSDGRVVVWGYFIYPPSAVVPGVVDAAGGWVHIAALKNDGTVVQWDYDHAPQTVPGVSNIVAIAAGGTHSYGLKADGTVVAWSEDLTPISVPAGISNVVDIAAAEFHAVALKRDGTLAAWGQMYFGQDPTPPANLTNVVAIAASGTKNVAIAALPIPPPITYPNQAYIFTPGGGFEPVPGFTNIKAFAVEGNYVLAVTRDGRVIGDVWTPIAELTNAVAVGLSYVQAAALTEDGRVIQFDSGEQPPGLTNVIAFDVFGQANDDDLDYKLAVTSDGRVVVWDRFEDAAWDDYSVEVPGVIAAAGGWSHVVALKNDGTVAVLGNNDWGQLSMPSNLNSVVAVAAGGDHSLALKADGTVVTWGANYFGQLNMPANLSNVVSIAAAEHHSLALKSDGTLVAWGQSYFGGSVTPPPGLSNAIAIAASGTRNLALVSFPPSQPLLTIAGNAPGLGQLTIRLSGDANTVYAVETSADLTTWEFLRNVTNETGSVFFDVGNAGSPQKFFKANRLGANAEN